jgi:CelD/BcsL family acetyltransferase involved in cellulose biosynthesis
MIGASFPISLQMGRDMNAVGIAWRELERQAISSFFQSWTWVGCLVSTRLPDPVLLQAEADGRTVGLALLNRTRRLLGTEQLWLNESGHAAMDAIYVEHNGMLLAQDAVALLPGCVEALLTKSVLPSTFRRRRQLRLAGVGEAYLKAAGKAGAVHVSREAEAPFVNLAKLSSGADAYLAGLSANTRYQLRRSNRCFARLGELRVRPAETLNEALSFLDALATLHQKHWTKRGARGAFANPAFVEFHRSLVERALPRGELVLLRISAGPLVLGYLYNFKYKGRVYAYQSGFDYTAAEAAAGPHAKPGLTSHHLAIERARAEGAEVYDFLAGPDRYKTSLANDKTALYWLEVTAPRSWRRSLTF